MEDVSERIVTAAGHARPGLRGGRRLADRRRRLVAGVADPVSVDRVADRRRARARVPGRGLAKPAEDGRHRRRTQEAGGRRRESAVGRRGRKGLGAKRTRRSDQADQRRQDSPFPAPRRRRAPRRAICRPSTPGSRTKPTASRRCRARTRPLRPSSPACRARSMRRTGLWPRPRPRPRPRRRSSRPCRARSTRRPPNSTPSRPDSRREAGTEFDADKPEPMTG